MNISYSSLIFLLFITFSFSDKSNFLKQPQKSNDISIFFHPKFGNILVFQFKTLYIRSFDYNNKAKSYEINENQVKPFYNTTEIILGKEVDNLLGFIITSNGDSHLTFNNWKLYYNQDPSVEMEIEADFQGKITSEGYYLFTISNTGRVNLRINGAEIDNKNGVFKLFPSDEYFATRFLTDTNGYPLYVNMVDTYLNTTCMSDDCQKTLGFYQVPNGKEYFDDKGNFKREIELTYKIGYGINSSLVSIIRLVTDKEILYIWSYNGFPLFLSKTEKTPNSYPTHQGLDEKGRKWFIIDEEGNVITQTDINSKNKTTVKSWSKEQFNNYFIGSNWIYSFMIVQLLYTVLLW